MYFRKNSDPLALSRIETDRSVSTYSHHNKKVLGSSHRLGEHKISDLCLLNMQLRASPVCHAYTNWHFFYTAAYITLRSVGKPCWIFADLFNKVLVMVSDLLKQLLMNVFDSFIGIFSGVTLLVYLSLAKCDIRFFGLRYATIGGSVLKTRVLFYYSFTSRMCYFRDTL